MAVSIVIAEDNSLMRKTMVGLFENMPGMEVVGESADGGEAIRLAQELKPDIMIMDVRMPKANGIKATRKILDALPGVKILAISMYVELPYIREMFSAGASGYITKLSMHNELPRAVDAIINNGMYVDRHTAKIVALDFIKKINYQQVTHGIETYWMGDNAVLLRYFGQGFTAAYISEELSMDPSKIRSIRSKLLHDWSVSH